MSEGSRKGWILGATAAGIFTTLIDETVVGVAVPFMVPALLLIGVSIRPCSRRP